MDWITSYNYSFSYFYKTQRLSFFCKKIIIKETDNARKTVLNVLINVSFNVKISKAWIELINKKDPDWVAIKNIVVSFKKKEGKLQKNIKEVLF